MPIAHRLVAPVRLLLASTLSIATGAAQQPAPAATFRLSGDVQTFPLRLIDAFPFIEGEVNGQPGKFMFDTGNADDLNLNSHLLKLPAGRPLGQGSVGSGQKSAHRRLCFSEPVYHHLGLGSKQNVLMRS